MVAVDGWKKAKIGELAAMPLSYGLNAPAVPYSNALPRYVRITDITDDGRLNPDLAVSVNAPESSDYLLQQDDILLARTGASVGKSYFHQDAIGNYAYAGYCIRLRVNQQISSPRFIFACLHRPEYWRWVKSVSVRSGQPGINSQEYASLEIPLPSLAEQRAISEALTEIDELIEAAEILIRKRSMVREGVARSLLEGKIRLSNTHSIWREITLGEIGDLRKGAGISRGEAGSGSIPCIRYGEIYTDYSAYTFETATGISADAASRATRMSFGDIVFACTGETKEDIGKCVAYMSNTIGYAGGDTHVFTPNRGIDPVFLSSLLNTSEVRRQKAAYGQGDAVVHISGDSLKAIELCIPPYEEQQAIAKVLMDFDNEIAANEHKLEKYRQIRQGMMRELLTGHIRLVQE